MILTQRQLDILNHIVTDGQVWADNAKKAEHVLVKVAKYEVDYDEAVAKGNYLNRKQRDDAEAVTEQERYDNVGYDVKRSREYASIPDQLDMLYWDKENGTNNWKKHIDKVKSDIPKE
jgi:D-serine dehydratase